MPVCWKIWRTLLPELASIVGMICIKLVPSTLQARTSLKKLTSHDVHQTLHQLEADGLVMIISLCAFVGVSFALMSYMFPRTCTLHILNRRKSRKRKCFKSYWTKLKSAATKANSIPPTPFSTEGKEVRRGPDSSLDCAL